MANAVKRAVGPNARQAISCWSQNTEEHKNGERNAIQTAVAVTVVQQGKQRKIKTTSAQHMARWLQQWKHGQLRALLICWRSNFTREALPAARILSTKARKFSLLCVLKVLCVWNKDKQRQAEYIYRHEALEGWKSGLYVHQDKLKKLEKERLKLDRNQLSPTSKTAHRRRLQPSALRTASDDDIMAAFLRENPDLALQTSAPEVEVEVEVETQNSADKEVLQMVRQGKSTMSPKQINETRRRRKSISGDTTPTLRSSSPIPTMGSDLML